MRRHQAIASIAAALALCVAAMQAGAADAKADKQSSAKSAASRPAPSVNVPLVLEPVRGNVYLIGGAGANIVVQTSDDGVLLVDTGDGRRTDEVIALVRKLSSRPIYYIVNTHFDLDHTGGNAAIASVGRSLGGGNTRSENHATIVAHENVLERVSAAYGNRAKPLLPEAGWPVDSYFTGSHDFFFNGEAVELLHYKSAHTDGDSVVFLRRSDVIVAGDIFNTGRYPMIDFEGGGTINGIINALNRVIDLAIPDINEEGGTLIVPGHGHIGDEYDIVTYRDALTVIRDRIADSIKRGMTLAQIKKSEPTLDYDGEYGGSNAGPASSDVQTGAHFTEAVYRSLINQPADAPAASAAPLADKPAAN